MNGSEDRQIGILTAEVANLKSTVEKQGQMLQEMRDVIVSTKGSWKTLLAMGGFLMALTSLATGIVMKLWPGNS